MMSGRARQRAHVLVLRCGDFLSLDRALFSDFRSTLSTTAKNTVPSGIEDLRATLHAYERSPASGFLRGSERRVCSRGSSPGLTVSKNRSSFRAATSTSSARGVTPPASPRARTLGRDPRPELRPLGRRRAGPPALRRGADTLCVANCIIAAALILLTPARWVIDGHTMRRALERHRRGGSEGIDEGDPVAAPIVVGLRRRWNIACLSAFRGWRWRDGGHA